MKTLGLACLLALVATGSLAQTAAHSVRGYTKADGTYVAPHLQTNPNSTTSDNYSTRGNTNPYTGAAGTKPDPRPSYVQPANPPPTYGSPAPPPYSFGAPPPKPCTSLYGC